MSTKLFFFAVILLFNFARGEDYFLDESAYNQTCQELHPDIRGIYAEHAREFGGCRFACAHAELKVTKEFLVVPNNMPCAPNKACIQGNCHYLSDLTNCKSALNTDAVIVKIASCRLKCSKDVRLAVQPKRTFPVPVYHREGLPCKTVKFVGTCLDGRCVRKRTRSVEPRETIRSNRPRENIKSNQPARETIESNQPRETIRSNQPRETIESNRPRETIKSNQPRETIKSNQPARETIISNRPRETIQSNRPLETIISNQPRETIESNRPRETIKSNRPRETIRSNQPARETIISNRPRETIESNRPRETIKSNQPLETIESNRPRETIKSNRHRARRHVITPAESINEIFVKIDHYCRERYQDRRDSIIGRHVPLSKGCQYVCEEPEVWESTEPFKSPDDVPCHPSDAKVCNHGNCRHKGDVADCRAAFNTTDAVIVTRIQGYPCSLKCTLPLITGWRTAYEKRRPGARCSNVYIRNGFCNKQGLCIQEPEY